MAKAAKTAIKTKDQKSAAEAKNWTSTVLSFLLQLNALKKISAFTSNLTYNLEPVYGIILAFVIFHENKYLTSAFYAGLSLILSAVILQTLRVYAKRKGYRLQSRKPFFKA